jgi:hypothetical protein
LGSTIEPHIFFMSENPLAEPDGGSELEGANAPPRCGRFLSAAARAVAAGGERLKYRALLDFTPLAAVKWRVAGGWPKA